MCHVRLGSWPISSVTGLRTNSLFRHPSEEFCSTNALRPFLLPTSEGFLFFYTSEGKTETCPIMSLMHEICGVALNLAPASNTGGATRSIH